MTGDIDQEEIDGARKFKRGAIVIALLAVAGVLIWSFV